jgi:hypothetical protein
MPISGQATPEEDFPRPSHPISLFPCAGKPKMRQRNPLVRLCRLILAFCFLLESFSALANPLRCPESKIEVTGGKKIEQKWVCAAAREAEPFFRLNELKLPKGLTLLLADRLPGNDGGHALGQYDARSNSIRILTYDEAVRLSRQDPPPLGLPMSPELWRSYIVHELAHAAAEKAFTPGVGKFTASEYIAAVAQLTSLSRETREKIIRHFPNLTGFENRNEITALYYFFAPGKFAVKAYLHYSRPENGSRFIRRLLREGLPSSSPPLFLPALNFPGSFVP